MSLTIYCDDEHEGIWFRRLSQHLVNVPINPIRRRGLNPFYIEKLLRYDKPDIILVDNDYPKVVVEKTAEVPTGHNIGQRFGRIVNAAEEGVMGLFFIPFAARKHGKHSGVCYMPGRFFMALHKIQSIHKVPILAINWPSDNSYELIRNGSENIEIGELIDDLIYCNFDYSKCERISMLWNRMTERYKVCKKSTFQPPLSAKIRNTQDYIDEITRKIPDHESQIPTLVRYRPLSLVYEIRITEEKCKRTDPYTGTQFVYDYIECRKGPNITDKISNLILYLPNISRKIWLKSNPNKILRKSALWYATADMIVLKDSIIGCISKVGPRIFQKQILKMLDENRLYQKVKEYRCNNWIILGGQPARGTDHLPVIEVRDFANQIKGSYGTKKIDLVAFKSGFFLLCELHSSYSHGDIIKLNRLTGESYVRQSFINSLLEKRVLESNNITIQYQKYTDSERYLIKAIGHNMSNRSSPDDFVSFAMGESTVTSCCGNAVPYDVRQLFSCSQK